MLLLEGEPSTVPYLPIHRIERLSSQEAPELSQERGHAVGGCPRQVPLYGPVWTVSPFATRVCARRFRGRWRSRILMSGPARRGHLDEDGIRPAWAMSEPRSRSRCP